MRPPVSKTKRNSVAILLCCYLNIATHDTTTPALGSVSSTCVLKNAPLDPCRVGFSFFLSLFINGPVYYEGHFWVPLVYLPSKPWSVNVVDQS